MSRVTTIQPWQEDRGPMRADATGSHLRVRGKWLDEAGFAPGAKVSITQTQYGVLELRVIAAEPARSEDFKAALGPLEALGL